MLSKLLSGGLSDLAELAMESVQGLCEGGWGVAHSCECCRLTVRRHSVLEV